MPEISPPKYMNMTPVDMAIDSYYASMDLDAFIHESNNIEGEGTDAKAELPVYEWWLQQELTEENLMQFHKKLCDARKQLLRKERGVYRKCKVYIGVKEFPNPGELRRLMIQFFGELPNLSIFAAHKMYENIHPFVDLNGRTGRAIWLHQMIRANKSVRLGFLHTWYYQSLSTK